MKIPFVYWWPEGARARNGLNYRRDWASRFCSLLKLFNMFYFYFRVRSKNVGGTRVLWSLDIKHPIIEGECPIVDWDTNTVRVGKKRFSWKDLQDLEELHDQN